MRRHAGEKRQEKAKAAWGASLSSPSDISAVFVKYASGATLSEYAQTKCCPGMLCILTMAATSGMAYSPPYDAHAGRSIPSAQGLARRTGIFLDGFAAH